MSVCMCLGVFVCVCVWRCVHSETRAELSCLFVRDEPEQVPSARPPGQSQGSQTSAPLLGFPSHFLCHAGPWGIKTSAAACEKSLDTAVTRKKWSQL